MKSVLFGLLLLLCSCASGLKTDARQGLSAQDSLKAEIPKINMAAELAKLDTMLIADFPNSAAAHENFLRALDMLEIDRIIFAELFYKRALANDPESHFLLSELIRILLKQNKTSEAFHLLKLAVQSPKATADNFLHLARLYKENKTLDSAEAYYKKATEKMSENFAVQYEYSLLLEYLRDKEYEQSDKELTLEYKRLSHEIKKIYDILLPQLDYPPRLMEKQIFNYHVTETKDSITANLLGEAFRANGIEFAEYGFWQAEILASMKKYSEANEVLLTLFFMHPSKDITSKLALRIANNYELMDSVTVAVIWLEQLLSQDRENHIAMNNLGYMLIDRNIDVNKGLALVNKALTYAPDESSYLDSKAWGLYKTGKYKEALEILEKLEASGMDEKELWLHLAKVCEALELHDRAKKYMDKARD
ncbi:MAG: hypothetical protein FWB90_04705 [Fibromonadales bacterium]|nr:hypothetical protein [Fibromonadales bacterium]